MFLDVLVFSGCTPEQYQRGRTRKSQAKKACKKPRLRSQAEKHRKKARPHSQAEEHRDTPRPLAERRHEKTRPPPPRGEAPRHAEATTSQSRARQPRATVMATSLDFLAQSRPLTLVRLLSVVLTA